MNNNSKYIFISTLGFALGMRQMAMTMVMPFLSVYSKTLKYNTPVLSGMSLGIFGLMQAVFQIPYGIWSDKKGNKVVMVTGLFQVILGLILAYFSTDIYILIIARAMQGSGAIIAVGYSWISSVSADSRERTNYMSLISIIIGVAAASSFAFGPLIHRFVSVKNMFLYSAVLIFTSWVIIIAFLKDNSSYKEKKISKGDNKSELYKEHSNVSLEKSEIDIRSAMRNLIKDKSFISLNLGAFINNFIMTGVFFIIPQYLETITGMDSMWKIFMPAVIIAVVIMRVVLKKLNTIQSIRFLILSFIIESIGICFYFNKTSFTWILIGTTLFMIGYISISTIIPSLSNFILEDDYRGAGNGVINSFQYIGSFVGAIIIAAAFSKNETFAFIILIFIGLLGATIIKAYVKGDEFIER